MTAPPYVRALRSALLCCVPMVAWEACLAAPPPASPSEASAGFDRVRCVAAPMLLAAAEATPTPGPAGAASSPDTAGAPGSDITTSSDLWTTTTSGLTQLRGHVQVRMDDKQIEADTVTYDRKANSLSVSGRVRFQDPAVLVQGDAGHYSEQGGQFNHASFQFLQQPGYGSAEQIWLSPTNVVTLRDVTYTSCPPPRADWRIRARELELDTRAGRGIGRGAVVDFKGVPIAYLPWISFPLSSARQSGFLFPDVGTSSRSGLTLGIPFYWNIAPNQDSTLTPYYYSQRGAALASEYRYLSRTNQGRLNANFIPYDSVRGSARNYLRLSDRQQFANNTRLDTHIESVSDTGYFVDFGQGTEATSTPFLARSVSVSHRDDIWNLRGEALGFQTLDDTLANTPMLDNRPYLQLPRLTASARWSPQHLTLVQTGFDSELVDFTRALGVTGWRLDLRPQIGLDVEGAGYFLRPAVAWEFTRYALRNAQLTPFAQPCPAAPAPCLRGDAPSRSLPIVTLDSGLEFERLAGSNGVRSVTLEPRLMYTYIPYRDQTGLPVFDTATPDLNLIELFRPNRYVGIDRIGDANEVTFGVTTRMFDSRSGARFLSATLGQAVLLSRPQVTLPGETPESTSTSSLIADVTVTAYHNWNLLLDAASNAAVNRIEQSEVALQYRADGHQVANIGYWFRSHALHQFDTSLAWPIARHWDAYARAVFSVLDHQWIEDFAGFQYRGDCWAIRVVAQRSVISHTPPVNYDTGVSAEVELTGLASVGSQVSTFLEHSIRGYSPAANSALRLGALR